MLNLKRTVANRETLVIGLILVLAALHGLLFVFLMPPWQHYDEPNHFEYVWLAANLDRLPSQQDYSPKLSRQVLKSMLENGFYDHMSSEPVVGPPSEKIKIPGISQLTEPPLYYLLASLPLRLIPSRGVDAQLYTARLVSWGFLLVTILAGWGVVRELTPAGHPLRWMLPLSLTLTPAFVDMMTAVNDDVAAIALASAVIYIGVRMIRRGFSLIDFTLLCVVSLLICFTKMTAMAVLIGIPFILLFSLLRGGWRGAAWGSAALVLFLGLAFVLRWDDAFGWFRNTSQEGPVRVESDQAPWGRHALAVESGAEVTPHYYPAAYQNIPIQESKKLAGKPITLGYWVWSDRSQRVKAPLTLRTAGQTYSETLPVAEKPTFYAFQVTLPEDTNRIWIDLNPTAEQAGSFVYYDGLVLVEGKFPINQPPSFSAPDAKRGEWGGQPFENLLRNPSAETPGPRLYSPIDNLAARFLPDNVRPSLLIATLVDVQGGSDLYPLTAWHLFRTFWARFAWGHVPLLGGERAYRVLLYVSLAGIFGALLGVIRNPRRAPWDTAVTLAVITIPTVLMALTRGGAYLPGTVLYYATARYLYPVILPLLLLFACGWLEIFQIIRIFWLRFALRREIRFDAPLQIPADRLLSVQYSLYLAFFLFLDVLSIAGIARYYYQLTIA